MDQGLTGYTPRNDGKLTMHKIPLSPEWRRVLEVLAGRERGSAEAVLRARGFSAEMLQSLARVGLATPAGGQLAPMMRITELGRQMLGPIVATGERAPIDKAVNESTQDRANQIAVRRH
jgi:hypothetical protein